MLPTAGGQPNQPAATASVTLAQQQIPGPQVLPGSQHQPTILVPAAGVQPNQPAATASGTLAQQQITGPQVLPGLQQQPTILDPAAAVQPNQPAATSSDTLAQQQIAGPHVLPSSPQEASSAVAAIIAQQHAALSGMAQQQPQPSAQSPVVAQQQPALLAQQQPVSVVQLALPVHMAHGAVVPPGSVVPPAAVPLDPGLISVAEFIRNLQESASAATCALALGKPLNSSGEISMSSSGSSGYSSASQSSLVPRPQFQSLGGHQNYSFDA